MLIFSVSSQQSKATTDYWRRMTVDTCVVLIWNFLVWSYRKVWILHRHHFKFQQKTALILCGKYICEFQNRKTTEEKMLQQKWQEWREMLRFHQSLYKRRVMSVSLSSNNISKQEKWHFERSVSAVSVLIWVFRDPSHMQKRHSVLNRHVLLLATFASTEIWTLNNKHADLTHCAFSAYARGREKLK